ncbi:MAG: hypothetical protein L6R37_004326 [Teloschistes peruensis]|nr:MAG: hypothetical protein L6R37_004326 [Teloschistes peruensis]
MPSKGFFDLPGEIRNHIYRSSTPHVLVVTTCGKKYVVKIKFPTTNTGITPVIQERGDDSSKYSTERLPIFHLNHAIRAEALSRIYEETTFATTILAGDGIFKPSGAYLGNEKARGPIPLKLQRFVRGPISAVPEPFVRARNWLLTLHWVDFYDGGGRHAGPFLPFDLREELAFVVEMLQRSKELRNLTIEYPCPCSFNHQGFSVWEGGCQHTFKSPSRYLSGFVTQEEIMAMLRPLMTLRVKGKAVFQPAKFQWLRRASPVPFKIYRCEEKSCRLLTKPMKETMEGTSD